MGGVKETRSATLQKQTPGINEWTRKAWWTEDDQPKIKQNKARTHFSVSSPAKFICLVLYR